MKYEADGVDYIYLKNGFKSYETKYGQCTSIMDLEKLHEAVARFLITRPKLINTAELDFIRKHLELTKPQLADMLGTRVKMLYQEVSKNDNKPRPKLIMQYYRNNWHVAPK